MREPKRLRLPLRLAPRLRDEDRDPPCGPRLVVRVRRIRRDGERPEPRPLGLVLDLANENATTYVNGAMMAQLDLGTGLSAGSAPFAYVGFYGPGNAGVSFDDVAAVVAP